MIHFQRILCPIDFSETSDRALRHATALASRYAAQLTVLHVVPCFDGPLRPSLFQQDGLHPFPSRDDVIAEIRRALERTDATAVSPAPMAEEGRVHEVIVNRAASLPADLLVLGTHGRSGFNRLFLGSVAEKVLRTASSCPVLTVPPSVPAGRPRQVTFEKILCPIDFSPSSLKALQYALELGRQADGCVTVLHVLEYMDPEESFEPSDFDPCRPAVLESRRRRQQRIDHARERLHAQLAGSSRTRCEIEETVAVNRAYKEILQRVSALDVDLVVMGAQGSSGIELMLYGSNTHHVVRHATCPVLTVRASGRSD